MESGCSPETCHSVSGELVVGSSPPQYRGSWDVTRAKGRWSIKVESPHRSNTASFKVDKRGQIVEVANSWKGAPEANMDPAQPAGTFHGGTNCNEFVGYVYGYVGLSLVDGTVREMYYQTNSTPDTQQGSIAFYHRWGVTDAWQHNAINVGGGIVDQNCNIGLHDDTVDGHSATHADLVNVDKYGQPVYRSTQELQDLDQE